MDYAHRWAHGLLVVLCCRWESQRAGEVCPVVIFQRSSSGDGDGGRAEPICRRLVGGGGGGREEGGRGGGVSDTPESLPYGQSTSVVAMS